MSRRRLLAASVYLGLLGAYGRPVAAQGLGVARESTVKAAFIYKFCAFVEWPAGAFAGPTAPAIIGVFGDDAVFSELEQVTRGREIQGHPISVVRIRDADALPVLHVLYAGGSR
ncbi:MAG TPA: YfiR family protein, partial [Vicinamibacterales bacterium]|nr:YfiR family protein [Vicinamibacterales bacterium]